jgi:biopolymer transport protein ExbD
LKTSLLVAVLTLLLVSCSGQEAKPKEEKIYYDTLNLLEPKVGKEDIASPQDYKHCIDLTQSGYIIVINKIKHQILDEQELRSFIKKARKEIVKQKISIISGSQTSYEKIIATLDLMTEQKIKEYKLVSVDGKLPQTSPIIVQSTKPFKKDIDLNDSTVLIILILDSSFETSLLKKKAVQSQISELDKFIVDNKNNIDPYKIVVTGAGNLPYKIVEPVTSLLAKHEYYNYHIIAKD